MASVWAFAQFEEYGDSLPLGHVRAGTGVGRIGLRDVSHPARCSGLARAAPVSHGG